MKINKIAPIVQRNNTIRRLIPLSEYKGPFLDLRFYEKDEIDILQRQLSELEIEAGNIIRTVNINKHLTGYQKNKCAFKLSLIEKSMNDIRDKITTIKKERFFNQMLEFSAKVKK